MKRHLRSELHQLLNKYSTGEVTCPSSERKDCIALVLSLLFGVDEVSVRYWSTELSNSLASWFGISHSMVQSLVALHEGATSSPTTFMSPGKLSLSRGSTTVDERSKEEHFLALRNYLMSYVWDYRSRGGVTSSQRNDNGGNLEGFQQEPNIRKKKNSSALYLLRRIGEMTGIDLSSCGYQKVILYSTLKAGSKSSSSQSSSPITPTHSSSLDSLHLPPASPASIGDNLSNSATVASSSGNQHIPFLQRAVKSNAILGADVIRGYCRSKSLPILIVLEAIYLHREAILVSSVASDSVRLLERAAQKYREGLRSAPKQREALLYYALCLNHLLELQHGVRCKDANGSGGGGEEQMLSFSSPTYRSRSSKESFDAADAVVVTFLSNDARGTLIYNIILTILGKQLDIQNVNLKFRKFRYMHFLNGCLVLYYTLLLNCSNGVCKMLCRSSQHGFKGHHCLALVCSFSGELRAAWESREELSALARMRSSQPSCSPIVFKVSNIERVY